MSVSLLAPDQASTHCMDDLSLNLVIDKEKAQKHDATEPNLKHFGNIADSSVSQKTFSLSKLCEEEPDNKHKGSNESEAASAAQTLLMSWRYENDPPKITREEIENAFKTLSIDIVITGTREFQHKIYIDCQTRIPKSQFRSICRYFESIHENTQFFMRYDKVNDEEQATVFLGNVIGLTANDLAEAIKKRLGFVPKAIRIPINKNTKKPKPIAYVVCDSRDQARELADNLRNTKLGLSSGIRTDLLVHDGDSRVTLKPRKPRSESKMS